MLKKYINSFTVFTLAISFVCSLVAIISLINYQDINKNQIPAFVIQQGKLSKNQIADFTKLSDAKNIWVINDNQDFNRATELIKQSADVISYANQIGRLDLVSILLGIIAIIFGFVGIIGFLHIKTMVEVQIDQAIKEEFKEDGNARKLIKNETNIFLSNRKNENAYDGEFDIEKIFKENNK
jgi:hypothetical protein